MGVYLGKIDIMNTYYNFTPLYEYTNNKFVQLLDFDYERVLPDSEKRNINFSYNIFSTEATDFMEDHFFEDVPIVFEFDKDELELNYQPSGVLNKTGYKIRTIEEFEKGRIKSPASYGCYLVFSENELSGDPRTTNILELGTDQLSDSTQVMIRLKDEGMFIGPYEVSYRSMDQTYVISMKPEDNRYILSGYDTNACSYINLDLNDQIVTYVTINQGAQKKYKDIITNKALLESFKSVIKEDFLVDGCLDLSNVDAVVKAYENSDYMVADTTIRRDRLQRITEMLNISDDVEDSIRYISEQLGADLGELISKYDDKDSADSLVNRILESNPELLKKIPDYSFTKNRISELKDEEEQLISELDGYQKELEKAKQLSSIDQETLRTHDEIELEIQAAKESRDVIKDEINELQNKYNQFGTYEQLEQGVALLRKENEYLEMRKDQLSRETNELSNRLSDVTTNIEKKLSEMSVDGLVANILVEASASWKNKQEHEKYEVLLNRYNDIEPASKTPEDMIEYMFSRVKEVRPLYDKNTVTNICTCIFQNFLTVFSGDPGCGKTSMCNIIGQALGLEKIGDIVSQDATRYIPVSVERGWTSKRDFVGYYNPLTKSFDKNNKRVFEALQLVDIEEKNNYKRFPMIILLDEANLSPMEYYWADFMNICDDLAASNEINIGESTVLNIPETLHFVATINNDHTTETLSPRLIDRAAVITLPKVSLREMSISLNTDTIDKDKIDIISWDTIKNTYLTPSSNSVTLPATAKKIYEEVIKTHFRKKELYVSPRTEIALIRYCDVSSRLFDRAADSARRDPSVIALDYAMSQNLLPKIDGSGEDYREWLSELLKKCEDNYLIRSKEIISDIIAKGDAYMSYYQFFKQTR